MAKIVETPLMKQYFEIKAKHPDAILLFRVGDFYEMYGDDAVVGAEILGIVQTKRANGVGQSVEMAGFPHHALDTYLPKLVRAGKRVAICDQLEDPKLTKKLVKRGITELVTPGVSINDNILNHKENNFLAAIHFAKDKCGIAFLDISTGEFLTAEGTTDYIDKLLNNFSPKEVLLERNNKKKFEEIFGPVITVYVYEDKDYEETLQLCDRTSPYGLTGSIFAYDRYAIDKAFNILRYSAGNFYINDKPTGAVIAQQPFGGSRASGTNDKAGGPLNLIRWTNPRCIKETLVPPTSYGYPFLGEE